MSVRRYLTIAAVVAILYALAFLVMPVSTSLFFSDFAEARAVLYLRFCGAAVLAWGLIAWFARDFHDWHAQRGVLIATEIGLAALDRPASKKRQGTKSRSVVRRRCGARYGDWSAA
jgi:hypothetical protein